MKHRKLNKNIFWLFIFSMLTINTANIHNVYGTEPPPFLSDIKIKATVNFNSQSGQYTYQYTVKNSDQSTGNLIGLDIDISYPNGGANLKKDGLFIPAGTLLRTFDQTVPTTAKVHVIPVGMERPENWIVGISIYGTASWGGGDYIQLKPKQSLNGFGLMSYGLPGMREFKADPALDVDAEYYPGEESVEDAADPSDAIIAKIDELNDKVSFKGRTIGPTAPPANFQPVKFLDYIVSLKKDAYYQGWIIQKYDDRDRDQDRDKDKDKDKDKKDKKNEKGKDDDKETGIMNSLDKKLDRVRAELVKGDNREAIEKLKAFTLEVAALYKEGKGIRQSHITSEAFALLYYNAQYLIDQLAGAKKEGRDKKDDKEKRD